MRLISLSVEGLYGTLNLELDFFADLNLLVGINGSGKTSALRVIDWLLAPSLPKLATQEYRRLQLNVEIKDREYSIVAEQSKLKVSIKIECKHDRFTPITIYIDAENSDRRHEEHYRGLGPEEHEKKAWNFLRDIKKPTVVSLERTITTETENDTYYERSKLVGQRQSKRQITPLEHIQRIFGEKYAEYRKIARENDSQLKSRIILTALHSPDSNELSSIDFKQPIEDTEQLEKTVKEYLSASIPSENVEDQVERFFRYFRSLAQEVQQSQENSGKVVNLIQSQFSRVDQLARAFKEFEKSNGKAFSRLSEYLKSVNLFLKDSGKTVVADPDSGSLVFTELMGGDSMGQYRPINKLSSGETQIIILFALMAFEASESSVFIVDEPELSLHPKWQTDFMGSFLGLRPKKVQVLVATHSPEIVAGRKPSCVFF